MDSRAPVLDDCLTRIRSGDRAAAADFVRRNEALIRRRYRHKVNSALRRLIDSEDLVSTLSRRLDAYIASGRLQAATVEQLWALIHRIVVHSVVDKGRVIRRLREVEQDDEVLAQILLPQLQCGGAEDIAALIACLDDGVDREIVSLWLEGFLHPQIAEQLGLSPEAVRKRWQRIRAQLRSHLEAA